MGYTWTYKEDLAVLHLKLAHGPDLTHEHPDVIALAKGLEGRSAASVWLRKRNFDYLETPGAGMRDAARQTRDIWERYGEAPDEVAGMAEKAYGWLARRDDAPPRNRPSDEAAGS